MQLSNAERHEDAGAGKSIIPSMDYRTIISITYYINFRMNTIVKGVHYLSNNKPKSPPGTTEQRQLAFKQKTRKDQEDTKLFLCDTEAEKRRLQKIVRG